MTKPGNENEVVDFGELLMSNGDPLESIEKMTNSEDEDDSSEKKEKPREESEIDINATLADKSEEEDSTEEKEKIDKPDTDKEEKANKKEISESPVSQKKDTSEEDSDSSFTIAFARYQREQGNLTSFDEEELEKIIKEEGEEAGMAYLQNKEVETIRNELLETYEDDVKYYLDLVDSGVDKNLAKDISKSKSFYDSVKKDDLDAEDKEELRRQIMTHRYELTTKFKPEKIKKLVEQAINLGEDIEESEEALAEIQNIYKEVGEQEKENIKRQEESRKKTNKKQVEELSTKIESLDEVIPGLKLTKTEKNKIKDSILKPVKEVNGIPVNDIWATRAKDPFKFDTILAALKLYGVFDGKWDKLVKGTKTKAVDELREHMKSNTSFKTTVDKSKASPTETGEKGSLDAMKRAFGNM